MIADKLLDEINARVSQVVASSPVKDVEKNLRASLTALLAKLDLVTRDEFDVQTHVLARTRERLAQLEQRVAQLEQSASKDSSAE